MKNSPRAVFLFIGKKMICICDKRTPKNILLDLTRKNFDILQLPLDPSLPEPVSGHSDLLVFVLNDTLLTRQDYYSIAKSEIDFICAKSGLKLLLSDARSGGKYPNDCGLCAAVAGNHLLYCENSSDPALLELATERDLTLLKVPQGYTKCSCAILSDGSVITADRGIAKITFSSGIETLLISEGHIDLPGYNYGFIGGASGLCGDTLYFCGDIKSHPDHQRITEFANAHGSEVVSLGNEALYDVGSLIFI